MQLERHDFGIGVLHTESGFADAIIISKKALEEWRDHYLKVADECEKEPYKWGLYIGKADVLTDLLKHFEEE